MAKKINYFRSHVRQGMTTIADHDNTGKRSKININLKVKETNLKDNTSANLQIDKEVSILGPGDVTGLNTKIISKAFPNKNTSNFEPSQVPFIEFSEPDFVWRYSCKTVNEGQNWIPWLSLIVLQSGNNEDAEFTEERSTSKDLPPRIRIKSNAVLPDLNQSWRWSHVNTIQTEGLSPKELENKIKNAPDQVICRQICARRLKPNTAYRAFLIPTYKIGAETALGNSNEDIDRRALLWDEPSEAIGSVMPYFYDWKFRTGDEGNFDTLVKKIVPREIQNLGSKTIDFSNPGYGIDEPDFILSIESALTGINGQEGNDPMPVEKKQQLAELFNRGIEHNNEETILRVTPPVYGEWYAGKQNSSEKVNVDRNEWLEEVNLDFRYRTIAGLGVEFVKKNQEGLMKSAWQQYNKVKKVNRELNLGRFGRELSGCMNKRLKELQPHNYFKLSLPLQNKVLIEGEGNEPNTTIAPYLKASHITDHLTHKKVRKYLNKRKGIRTGDALVQVKDSHLVSKSFRVEGVKRYTHQGTPSNFYQKSEDFLETEWVDNIVEKTKGAMDPNKHIVDRIKQRTKSFRGREKLLNQLSDKEDELRPVKWYPEFHQPMYHYLKGLSEEYILSGLENIPMNTVGLLQSNRKFVEAFMLGLNHEMASELRWREFPTDMRGSYFRSFWDTTIYSLDPEEKQNFRNTNYGQQLLQQLTIQFGNAYNTFEEIEAAYVEPNPDSTQKQVATLYEEAVEKWLLTRDEDKDIAQISEWSTASNLGNHPVDGKPNANQENQNQTVILLRAELLQKFNNVLIYLVPKNANGKPDFTNSENRKFPIFEGEIGADIVFLGFDLVSADAEDYFLIFEERITELQYGLDVTGDAENIGWEDFAGHEEGEYLDGKLPGGDSNWNNPAFIGNVMTRKQTRVAVKLSTLI
ncbi:hypothetical protein U6A24_02490 [Aquimarina gracilis]|uniref:Uncharacterized protein n=1 Tax=Aquimarina gracilis TaxID=874422 RepID=A0ABU5ZQH5_9FLAO|nr:hypothetical protein [Aquimarina gracilis]MEB3344308.1 hypothetical protein [Aquimarina gracilis]